MGNPGQHGVAFPLTRCQPVDHGVEAPGHLTDNRGPFLGNPSGIALSALTHNRQGAFQASEWSLDIDRQNQSSCAQRRGHARHRQKHRLWWPAKTSGQWGPQPNRFQRRDQFNPDRWVTLIGRHDDRAFPQPLAEGLSQDVLMLLLDERWVGSGGGSFDNNEIQTRQFLNQGRRVALEGELRQPNLQRQLSAKAHHLQSIDLAPEQPLQQQQKQGPTAEEDGNPTDQAQMNPGQSLAALG